MWQVINGQLVDVPQNTPYNGQFQGYPYANSFRGQNGSYGANMVAKTQTNKIFVCGVEGARALQTQTNSDLVVFDDTKDILYEIETDFQGKKNINIIDLMQHKEEPKIDASVLEQRITKLEEMFAKQSPVQRVEAKAKSNKEEVKE